MEGRGGRAENEVMSGEVLKDDERVLYELPAGRKRLESDARTKKAPGWKRKGRTMFL